MCVNCGASHTTWAGKCSQCGEWNTLQEQIAISSSSIKESGKKLETVSLSALHTAKPASRLNTGMAEVDNVLGGGVVPGV